MNENIDQAINYMSTRGYRVISQSQDKVQMVKPMKRSCLVLILLFLLGVIPAIFYVLTMKDRTLLITSYPDYFVSIDERGKQKIVSNNKIKNGNYSVLIPYRFPWMVVGVLLGLLILIVLI